MKEVTKTYIDFSEASQLLGHQADAVENHGHDYICYYKPDGGESLTVLTWGYGNNPRERGSWLKCVIPYDSLKGIYVKRPEFSNELRIYLPDEHLDFQFIGGDSAAFIQAVKNRQVRVIADATYFVLDGDFNNGHEFDVWEETATCWTSAFTYTANNSEWARYDTTREEHEAKLLGELEGEEVEIEEHTYH